MIHNHLNLSNNLKIDLMCGIMYIQPWFTVATTTIFIYLCPNIEIILRICCFTHFLASPQGLPLSISSVDNRTWSNMLSLVTQDSVMEASFFSSLLSGYRYEIAWPAPPWEARVNDSLQINVLGMSSAWQSPNGR